MKLVEPNAAVPAHLGQRLQLEPAAIKMGGASVYLGLMSTWLAVARVNGAVVFSENAGAAELVRDFAFSPLSEISRVEFGASKKAALKKCST